MHDKLGTSNLRVGVDLCSVTRVEKILAKYHKKFLLRILTESEREDFLKISSKKSFIHKVAGRFAAKEAIAKVFGTGIGKELSFQDIEVMRDPNTNAPLVKLSEKAKLLQQSLNISNIQISISHEEAMVIAFAASL